MNLSRTRCNIELAKPRLWGKRHEQPVHLYCRSYDPPKIVIVSLICASVVAGIGVAARVTDGTAGSRLMANVIGADTPVRAASNDIIIR